MMTYAADCTGAMMTCVADCTGAMMACAVRALLGLAARESGTRLLVVERMCAEEGAGLHMLLGLLHLDWLGTRLRCASTQLVEELLRSEERCRALLVADAESATSSCGVRGLLRVIGTEPSAPHLPLKTAVLGALTALAGSEPGAHGLLYHGGVETLLGCVTTTQAPALQEGCMRTLAQLTKFQALKKALLGKPVVQLDMLASLLTSADSSVVGLAAEMLSNLCFDTASILLVLERRCGTATCLEQLVAMSQSRRTEEGTLKWVEGVLRQAGEPGAEVVEALQVSQLMALASAGLPEVGHIALSAVAERLERGTVPSASAVIGLLPVRHDWLLRFAAASPAAGAQAVSRSRSGSAPGKQWERRFMVLTEQYLLCYYPGAMDEAREKIGLAGCSVRLMTLPGRQQPPRRCVELTVPTTLPAFQRILLAHPEGGCMTAWHDALAGALQQLPGTVHKELQSTEEGNVDGTASGATTDGGRATEALAAGTALGDGIEESLGVIVTDSGGGGTSGGGWLGHRRSPSRHSAASSAKDERKKVEPAAAVYVNMEASRLAGWDDICVRSAVPQLLELAQAASNAKVIEQTARILSVLAGHGAPRWHKLVATLDVIATGILLVKSPDAMTRLHAVTLLAHLSDSEVHPTGGRMAQSMINLGAGPALAAVLPTLKPIQWWPQVVYCVSRAALHSARSSPQAPQALLANGIVRNLVEALGVLSEDAGATMAIHLAALRLFHLFAASPEMRLEVTRQGGLSYLMSLHRGGHDEASSGGGGGGPLEEAESPGTKQEQAPAPRGKVAESADCREVVRRQAEAALEALYAQDDSVVTYLPVQAVLQLTRCGMVKVKAQGAKGLEAAAEGGHLLDAQSTAAEARDVVESAAALLSESLEALQIRAVDTGPSSPSSSQANGVPAIMYSVMANTVKAVAKLAKVKGIHQTYIARLASRGLLLVAGASEVAVGLRAEAAAVVVMVTQGVEDWEALVQCGTATMVLLGALNAGDMAGSSAVFSESLAAILAGVCSTDGGRQQVDLLDGVAAVASLVQEHRANAPKQTQASARPLLPQRARAG
ncbi:hypothetical protein CYMTET_15645 [Cymbomonas tetramitiformis]|uniref:PH domain-containing protein n=1 Tax=Cymbomonas tetramitiformis TaxID=36881 RepID=A0AAE0GDW8_9CHLO|nr:hypothetical protein CYMTET_15645 [Cymbomonas tetramitiformis]